jgi:pSer/pThr/pTyr-binding forkhead associated (FHA) protein
VELDPISVILKFGFLAVLYLFLLWVARSALRDLRSSTDMVPAAPADATAMHSAATGLAPDSPVDNDPRLLVERAAGLQNGSEYELAEDLLLGRGSQVDVQLEDPFASSRHARIVRQGQLAVIEDLGSTNGTLLNGEPLRGPQPLHPGDRIRIGDSEFSYVE